MTAVDLSQYHRSGPWILVAEREEESKALLREIDRQCNERGIFLESFDLAAARPRTLFRYKGMIVVLGPVIAPAQADPEVLVRALTLINRFRDSYPQGAVDLFGAGHGKPQWHEVGPVQFFADATAFNDLGVRAAINAGTICAHHLLREGKPVREIDVFAVYEPDEATTRRGSARSAMALQSRLQHLRDWRMTVTLANIGAVSARIDEWIVHYDDPKFKRLSDSHLNTLQWVIQDPEPTPELAAMLANPATAKNWRENTQRAARLVLEDLLEDFGIQRPYRNGVPMHGKRGQRGALSKLVTTLDYVADLYASEPDVDVDAVLIESLVEDATASVPVPVHE
ncbi:hypothetical protein ACWEKT_37495 [Nocardia takedensis]